MKRLGILLLAVLVLAGGAAAFWLTRGPRTPEAAFARASKLETRLEEKLKIERAAAAPDAKTIERHEASIRKAWGDLLAKWPESPEAARAAHRLLLRDLAAAADPQAKVKLIDDFLAARGEHEEKKNLLWKKAEILRDEAKDPLGAVDVFGQIETAFPKDAIAPKAALAKAAIYESIGEFGAASEAYRKLAEAYPASPEAEQAQMKLAGLLEEKLDRKREAAEVYQKVAEASPGSAAGKQAARRRQNLLGELKETDQKEYYKEQYGAQLVNPYDVTKEELNSPAMQRIRRQGFDVSRYEISAKIWPDRSEMEVRAAVIGRLARPPAEPLLFQLNPAFEVSEVKPLLEEEGEVKFSRRGPYLEVILPEALAKENALVGLSVKYMGKVGAWGGDSLTTAGASLRTESKWYPATTFGDLFTHKTTIDCAEPIEAVAQGGRIEADPAGLEAGFKRAAFEQREPVQLMTLALGKWESRETKGPDGHPIEIRLRPDHAGRMDDFEKQIAKVLEVYKELYGPLPFDRLTIAEVPDFPGGYGAPSLVLLGSMLFARPDAPTKLLAHEIAHQWWGNLVTLDLEDDSIPWLSEGFATYSDALFAERTEGAQAFQNQILAMGNFYRKNAVQFEDRPIAETLWSHPMYRSLIYEKGALALHELRHEMGDEAFFKFLRGFLEANRYKVVSTSALAEQARIAAGRDLDWHFEQTLARAGYARPAIASATSKKEGAGWKTEILIEQPEPAYRMKMDLAIETDAGEERIDGLTLHAKASESLAATTAARPKRVRLDPDNWLLIDRRTESTEKDVTAEP